MVARVNPDAEIALDSLPEALRDSTRRWLERYASLGDLSGWLPTLVRVVAVSEFAAITINREQDWLAANTAEIGAAPDPRELDAFCAAIAASDATEDTVKSELRRFRNRYLLRLLWRDVAAVATVPETIAGLSALADRLLSAAARYAVRQLEPRYGRLRDRSGTEVPLVVLGMGKLGGRELNFSSDIDIIFLYPSDGESDGPRALSAPEYFARLSRRVVALLDEVTSDGFVFRVDTRLRPFGASGPPVVSFGALESYLLQHGRGWERYAYVKARIVGEPPPDPVADELELQLVRPFVFRRYLDYGIFESLREMHALITAEVQRRELEHNVKLGPGGIREIEFIVQSLQLVRGGSRPALQRRNLLSVLPELVGRGGLAAAAAGELADAYVFLRRLENFIQAIRDRQTHELPDNETDRARLCVAMGFADWDALASRLDYHRDRVSRQFGAVAFRGTEEPVDDVSLARYDALWRADADAKEWADAFEFAGLPDAVALGETLADFAGHSHIQRVDSAGRERLGALVPRLLGLLPGTDRPADALTRTLAVVEKVLRRSAYIALLNENTAALSRLLYLCGRSGYLAEQLARHPALLDELLDPHLAADRIRRQDLAAELEARLDIAAEADSEQQIEILAQFQRASLFRIAVADFNDALPIMRVSDSLTDLAETVLDHALRVAWHDMTNRYGEPQYRRDGAVLKAGFGIVAYGKFGGIELSYGSDLDLVFLHDSHGEAQQTNGDRPLDNAVFFTRLVRRLVHFLTTQTGSGMLYEIDTRLRPDGRSGVLVTSVEAFERYQEENAWTWEHQALLRARPVAGSARIAREFERIRTETLLARVRREALRDDVLSMRRRMRKELDRGTTEQFDLKQGKGGIADIEFIVQYLVLANADRNRAIVHYPDNIRQLATLAATGCLDEAAATALQDSYRSYRLRLHHLSLDDRPPLVPATEFEAERSAVDAIWASVFEV